MNPEKVLIGKNLDFNSFREPLEKPISEKTATAENQSDAVFHQQRSYHDKPEPEFEATVKET